MGTTPLTNQKTPHPIRRFFLRALIFLVVLSLALALSIPLTVRDRAEVVALVSGFILVSLALQGLSIGPVFRWLRVSAVAAAP